MRAKRLPVLLFTLLYVSGCAQAPSPSPAESAPAGATPAPSVAGASAPAASEPAPSTAGTTEIPQNILTIAYPKDFASLDPATAFASENDLMPEIYETLTVFDVETGKIVPGLATSWDNSPDGLTWTFHLREGVKFQDGADFTADSVKGSFERTKKIGKGAAYLLDQMTSVKAVDPLTVEFDLSAPVPFADVVSSEYSMYIVSPDSAKQDSDWFQQGNGFGTGPYMWKSWKPGEAATLTYFHDYWGLWHPGQFTDVIYQLTPDASTRAQDVLTGQAQLTFNLTLQDYTNFESKPNLKVVPLNIIGIQYLLFNTQRPPLDNVKVRQALAYAFPIDDVVANSWGKYATKETHSYIPSGIWGHTNDLPGYTYDLAKAKQLLTEAGISDGQININFAWLQAYPEQKIMAELWKASLAQIGVNLDVQTFSFNALLATYGKPQEWPYTSMELWFPTWPSPQDFIFSIFASKGGGNVSYYKNPKVDALIDQGLAESSTDQAKATETFKQAQALIFADMPGIPVVNLPETYVAASNISGFKDVGIGMYIYALTSTTP